MNRLNTGVPPALGVRWLAWCARHANALRVAVVPPAATVSHSPVCQCACWTVGVPMPLTDPGFGQLPPGFLFFAPFRVAGGVKMGAIGLPPPPSSTAPATGAKTSFLCSAKSLSSLA